jgi:hypothetical protein
MQDSPRNLIVNDINCSNLGTMATSSSIGKLPKTRTPSALAAGFTKLTQAPPEGTATSEFSLPLHIPHEHSRKDSKVTRSERFVPPSLPTYSQYKPPVESVSQSYGTGTKVLGGAFNHGVRGGHRIEAAGLRKETPEMSFSPPSVPSYAVYGPVAGFFSEPVRQSLPGMGNTATKYQYEATKIREQRCSANAPMSTHPPLQGQVMNGWSNIFQSQGAEFADNQPPTFCTSSRPGPSLIGSHEPLSRSHPLYETQYTVSSNTSFSIPVVNDRFLTHGQPFWHALNLHPSCGNMEPDIFKSNTCTDAITMDAAPTQRSSANTVLNHGSAFWMPNSSLTGMNLVSLFATPNYHIPVTINQIESDLKLHSSDPTKSKIGPQITETVEVESTKVVSDEATIKQTRDVDQNTFIPSTLPEDIQAIIDSYLSGRPVLLIISNKRFFDCWSLCLPEEFGFSMLGYFRILGVQV